MSNGSQAVPLESQSDPASEPLVDFTESCNVRHRTIN
jgi:hypothetical protein